MNSFATNEVLNRLMVIHHRSLPTYLRDAPPFMGGDDRADSAREVLSAMVSDNQRLVDELGELLLDRNWPIHYGEYPLKYTAYHDLSLDFLLDRLIEEHRRNIERIEHCVRQLEGDATAQAIAERALGAAKAHLENLQTSKTPRAANAL